MNNLGFRSIFPRVHYSQGLVYPRLVNVTSAAGAQVQHQLSALTLTIFLDLNLTPSMASITWNVLTTLVESGYNGPLSLCMQLT